jgi:hypothetical protein
MGEIVPRTTGVQYSKGGFVREIANSTAGPATSALNVSPESSKRGNSIVGLAAGCAG